MLQKNYAINILIENASSYAEKQQIFQLNEAEQAVVNDKMVGNIYQSALKRKDIDYDQIPATKGDIQKFHGYDNIVATLNTVRSLSKKFGIKIDELDVVEQAVTNVRIYRGQFERGFSLGNDFMMMYYNNLVFACVEATSIILASYVDYVKTINNVDFVIKKAKGINGNLCIDNLRKFNESVRKGDFVKFANNIMNKDRQNFVGGGAMMMAAAAIAVSIVPVARELVYYFYESRMRVSDYLDQQAKFLAMNEVRLNSAEMPADKRNKVLNTQKDAISTLEKISDKIKINHQLANKSAVNKLKDDNKGYTMQSVSGNEDGFMFI